MGQEQRNGDMLAGTFKIPALPVCNRIGNREQCWWVENKVSSKELTLLEVHTDTVECCVTIKKNEVATYMEDLRDVIKEKKGRSSEIDVSYIQPHIYMFEYVL